MILLKSVVGAVMAFVICAAIWMLTHAIWVILISLFSSGKDNILVRIITPGFAKDQGMLTYLWVEAVTPAIGAYFAVQMVNKIFKEYNRKVFFYTYSAIFIFFVIISFTLTIVGSRCSNGIGEDFLSAITSGIAIGVTYFSIIK